MKRRTASTSVSPCLGSYIHNVLVGSIENKSLLIPVSFPINRNKEPEIVEVKALVYSGAGGKFIDQNSAKSLKLKLKKLKKKLPVFNVDGTPNKLGTISYKTKLRLTIGDKRKEVILLVTGLGKQEIILGLPWLKEENPDINWRKGTLTWREEEEEIKTATDEERSLKRDELPAISRIEEVEDDDSAPNLEPFELLTVGE